MSGKTTAVGKTTTTNIAYTAFLFHHGNTCVDMSEHVFSGSVHRNTGKNGSIRNDNVLPLMASEKSGTALAVLAVPVAPALKAETPILAAAPSVAIPTNFLQLAASHAGMPRL